MTSVPACEKLEFSTVPPGALARPEAARLSIQASIADWSGLSDARAAFASRAMQAREDM